MTAIETIDTPVQRPQYAPGWYRDLTNEEYHGSSGYSSSQIKTLIEQTPAHLKLSFSKKNESTPTQAMGSALHTMVLEPWKKDDEIAISPVFNRRTNTGKDDEKAFLELNAGKAIITEPVFKEVELMAKSVREHPYAGALLEDIVRESSVYWWYRTMDNDEIESGEKFKQMLKVRPDAIPRGHCVLLDLKSTRDASYTGFTKQILNYGYHVSAAMYLEGVNQCRPLLDEMQRMAFNKFLFICVENFPPYLATVYELSPAFLDLGKSVYRHMMRKLRDGIENDWPGYPEEIRIIEPPTWASRGFVV